MHEEYKRTIDEIVRLSHYLEPAAGDRQRRLLRRAGVLVDHLLREDAETAEVQSIQNREDRVEAARAAAVEAAEADGCVIEVNNLRASNAVVTAREDVARALGIEAREQCVSSEPVAPRSSRRTLHMYHDYVRTPQSSLDEDEQGVTAVDDRVADLMAIALGSGLPMYPGEGVSHDPNCPGQLFVMPDSSPEGEHLECPVCDHAEDMPRDDDYECGSVCTWDGDSDPYQDHYAALDADYQRWRDAQPPW